MNIWVPYTRIEQATAICLRSYDFASCLITDDDGYRRFLVERWADGRDFINIEHDVVFWPGALEELWGCPEPWCAFGYSPNDNFADHVRTLFPYLGCVKFAAPIIAASPGAWDDADDWLTLDRHIASVLRSLGFDVHQHFPPVVNANPVLIAAEV